MDAVRFALGENKPKILRAENIQSLIHDTSPTYGLKASRTSVEFDNSDRKIPVDSNTVRITREIVHAGESTCYLNQRKVSRAQVLDLLDDANLGLDQLNVIKYETVKKVSKFTSEQLRITIENLIGLSYFDEKMTYALRPDEIENEKHQAFLDAFNKIDKEVRYAFSKITGGLAWLELQNKDDIFSSDISYFIQLPNKPKKEFTSTSGTEKMLSALVFVLALQKLKPSPFYLFDEVDNNLDEQNSEGFAKIIEERSQNSQVIMVTWKDTIVQKANSVYGVFPNNGVSKVVSYKEKN